MSNVDGKALIRLDQIALDGFDRVEYNAQDDDWWTPVYGRRIAFTAYRDEYDPVLYVYELPVQRLVAEIPLLSDMTRASVNVIEEDSQYDVSLLNAILQQRWSPDGRYLAFAAAIDDSTSDLYVLDTDAGAFEKIAEGANHLEPAHWSPDGRWLLYQDSPDVHIEGFYPHEVWVYDTVRDATRYLYTNNGGRDDVLGWLDGDSVVTVSRHFEGNNTHPRRVDMATGESELLDDRSFGHVALDPINGVLLLNYTPIMWVPEGVNPSEFVAVDVQTQERGAFTVPSESGYVRWVEGFNRFITDDGGNSYLFDERGNSLTTLPGDSYRPQSVSPSPDGQIVAVRTGESWDLYRADGTLLADLNLKGKLYWLADSRILALNSNEIGLTLTLRDAATDWQPQPAITEIAGMHGTWVVE